MLRCWDSLAKGGLHHACRQGRVANVTDEQTVTDWEAAPVIAYVVWFHTFGAALPQSQIPCAGSFLLPAHSCDFDTKYERNFFSMNQNRMESSRVSDLVDIRTVAVDKSLPKEERIADFVRQIKNPYRFRCGDFVVNASFARNGATLEDCLRGILR